MHRDVSDATQIATLKAYLSSYAERVEELERRVFIWRSVAIFLMGMVAATIYRMVMGG